MRRYLTVDALIRCCLTGRCLLLRRWKVPAETHKAQVSKGALGCLQVRLLVSNGLVLWFRAAEEASRILAVQGTAPRFLQALLTRQWLWPLERL